MGARVTRCSGNATGAQRRAYSRVCGAATALRPVAVGVGGAERGAPMSQSAYRRVRVAATPKPPVAKEGATGSRLSGAARRQDPLRAQPGSPAALGYAGPGPGQRATGAPVAR